MTRLGQSAFVPAITNDVSAGRAGQRALAEEIDAEQHQGLPPYAAYVAANDLHAHARLQRPAEGD